MSKYLFFCTFTMERHFSNAAELRQMIERYRKECEAYRSSLCVSKLTSEALAIVCFLISNDEKRAFQVYQLGIDSSLVVYPMPSVRYPEIMNALNEDAHLRLICGYAFLDRVRDHETILKARICDTFGLNVQSLIRKPSSRARCHTLSPIEAARMKFSVDLDNKNRRYWRDLDDYQSLVCSRCQNFIVTLKDGQMGVAKLKAYLIHDVYKEFHIYAFVCDECRNICNDSVKLPGVCLGCFHIYSTDSMYKVPIRYDRAEKRGQPIIIGLCPECFNQAHINNQIEKIRYVEVPIQSPLSPHPHCSS